MTTTQEQIYVMQVGYCYATLPIETPAEIINSLLFDSVLLDSDGYGKNIKFMTKPGEHITIYRMLKSDIQGLEGSSAIREMKEVLQENNRLTREIELLNTRLEQITPKHVVNSTSIAELV